jgi:hypothetical protein
LQALNLKLSHAVISRQEGDANLSTWLPIQVMQFLCVSGLSRKLVNLVFFFSLDHADGRQQPSSLEMKQL